ncbi:MAG: LSU ribosomal protein L10p (P0) [uncultured Solirubrobacteraceae bacterium]|uniref:Large ribosomal subunit protein uL10 n=1 Tax=uncultured Solirubrobacteraceae bacterium TaxID=1162706 RepID=A0A6J4SQ63_9ACTN|nr:MAG: LSU ribosomal protein L10p (P0) [uncultured Solirubrobacteraceae bacterium]
MNREQKSAVIDEISAQIQESEAVFAVDYRGISVVQAAELRTKLRDADASLRVVKNTLTIRAADQAGAEALKAVLEGPTALTFVRGDAATAAKAVADYARTTGLLPFKGGMLNGEALAPEQMTAIARLPSRDVLNAQFVNIVASPLTGLVTSLSNLISGLARQLSQVAEKKEAGEIPAGDAPTSAAPAAAAAAAAAAAPEEDADLATVAAAQAEADAPVESEAAAAAAAPEEDADLETVAAAEPTPESEAAVEAEAAPADDSPSDTDEDKE